MEMPDRPFSVVARHEHVVRREVGKVISVLWAGMVVRKHVGNHSAPARRIISVTSRPL
jgi:hypothetical protein